MGPKISPPKSPTDHEDAQNDAAVPADDGALSCSQKLAHGREQDDGIEIAVHDVEGPAQASTDQDTPLVGRQLAIPFRFRHGWVKRQQRPQG